MVTDGLIERNAGDGPLGYERFEQTLKTVALSQKTRPDVANQWLEELQRELDAASGHWPEEDDCTVMVICSGGD